MPIPGCGNTITFTPESNGHGGTTGQVSTATDAAGDQTTFGYDPTTFDLTSVTDPNGKKTSATYDGDGRLKTVTDPLRNTTTYQLDNIGKVTQVTDARNGTTKYGYDDVGNLLTVTDARNHATATNTFDLRNRLTETCDALNRCVTFDSYDADDNLTQHTNAAGEIDQFKFDNLNRRTENDYTVVNGTPTDYVTLSYDLGDRLYQAVDKANGTVTRQFGQAGSPTGTNTTEASGLDFISQEVTPNGTVKNTPDLAGRRTTMQFGSLTYNYGYDNANKLTSVSVPSTWSVTKNFNYSAGRLGSITLPNGLMVSYTYDNDSHVASVTFGTLGGLSYTYDADGRRTGVSGGFATTSIPLASLALTYNNDNSLATIGGTTVTNSPGGNITGMTGSCAGCNGTLSYDPQGNLQESYLFIGGQWVDRYNYYDALGRLQSSAITIGSNTTPVNAVYDGFNVLETYNASAYALSLLGLGLDELYLEDFNGTVQSSVLKDALGSEVGLTDPTKGLTDTYSYEPYGVPTHTYGTTLDPGQFAGIPYDGNSGLYYMRHRWYLPAIGRFISRDPIGIAGGINVYAYANDDPVDFSDPTGLCSNPTYDGPSEGGNTQQGANNPSGEGPGQGIGGYLSYPGFTPGVGIVTGIVGGPPSLQQNGLLPARGGAGPGGDVPEIYYGQNGGGIMLVQQFEPGSPGNGTSNGGQFNPSVYADRIHHNLETGSASRVGPICVGGGGICVFTGFPPACWLGAAACTAGIAIESYCTAKAFGNNPPPLPPAPSFPRPRE